MNQGVFLETNPKKAKREPNSSFRNNPSIRTPVGVCEQRRVRKMAGGGIVIGVLIELCGTTMSVCGKYYVVQRLPFQ
jgi:hypothetical protein